MALACESFARAGEGARLATTGATAAATFMRLRREITARRRALRPSAVSTSSVSLMCTLHASVRPARSRAGYDLRLSRRARIRDRSLILAAASAR